MDNKPSTWLKVKKNPRVSPKGILSEQNEFTEYQLSHGGHGHGLTSTSPPEKSQINIYLLSRHTNMETRYEMKRNYGYSLRN